MTHEEHSAIQTILTQIDKRLAALETAVLKRQVAESQNMRRLRESLAKVTAERKLLRRMLSAKQAAAEPTDYDTLKQHSHRKNPQ